MPELISGGGGSVTPSSLAGYEIHYKQITSSVVVSSTTEASGTTIITCDPTTFDGGLVIAHFYCPYLVTADPGLFISLFEGATQITRFGVSSIPSGAGHGHECSAFYRFTPTAGSHTYTVTGHRSTSNGTVTAGAGGTAAYPPAFIRFTKA